ncbi:mannose-6-phosphate isomerase, class I [Arthrobacter sp. 35W]|uniref:mannose-6-phosphate isomerase, class I n=1 Tax=Arthrobacter sp. 35W TaxID=1132441 RepID=UPI0004062DBD|nr:mannose-6-phosphate isomerase, class I [Arthrobacter sp. 35W]
MYSLSNTLRPYVWGSGHAIAELLGTTPSGGPEAELWLGAHPDSPSRAQLPDGTVVGLDELIASDPSGMLGADSRAAFGDRLPFLAKLLAAETPLSLQVHPTLEQARVAYAAEEAAGVPRTAAHRNYKDDNHKPEMIFALTDFEALCGFRHCADAAILFRRVGAAIEATGASAPALLVQVLAALNSRIAKPVILRRAFELLIGGGAEAADLVAQAAAALTQADPDTLGPELSTVVSLAGTYPGDPGVLISLLLNRVSLKPGEAMYLPAGNIHAYLHGLGVEVMASSDNVLRGGLTPKHVDVPELLATVDFRPLPVPLIEAVETELGQQIWAPPFAEFQLQRIELAPGGEPVPLAQNGPLLVLAVAGSVLLDSPRADVVLNRGSSVFVPASEEPVLVHAHTPGQDDDAGTAVVFAVTVSGLQGA